MDGILRTGKARAMLENYRIRRLERSDLEPLKTFTDREIGDGYYSPSELEDVFVRSSKDGTMYTLVLENLDHELVGVRITYPPGTGSMARVMG